MPQLAAVAGVSEPERYFETCFPTLRALSHIPLEFVVGNLESSIIQTSFRGLLKNNPNIS